MEDRLIYYNEKLSNLIDKLFIDSGDARNRFINYEEKIEIAYNFQPSQAIAFR